MFRRALCFALTVLALGLGVAPGLADSTAPPKAPAADDSAANYAVSIRKPGTIDWTEHRTYPGMKDAQDAAESLQNKGFEVQVMPRFAIARMPARPKTARMPVGETVTPEQLAQIFRWMRGQNDIAYRFPLDGCYARAHLMVRRMEARGYTPFKVWSIANGGEMLQVRTANHPRGQVEWRYHVAPAVRVRYPSGNQFWFVIDPALFDRPVRINDWKSAQKKTGARYDPYVTMTRVGVAPKDPKGVRMPGSGYWLGRDPRNVDTHATGVMRLYKPYEGRIPPKSVDKKFRELTFDVPSPGSIGPLTFEPRRRLALAA